MLKFNQIAFSVVSLVAAVAAQAAPIPVTLIVGTPVAIPNGYADSSTVPYVTQYSFAVPTGSLWDISGGLNGENLGLPVTFFSDVTISAIGLGGTASPAPTTFAPGMATTFSFDGVAAGNYVLSVSALLISGTGGPNGVFSGFLRADTSLGSSTVPEPTGLALALAGLGVCALMLRRRS